MTSIEALIDRQLRKWELEQRAAAETKVPRELPPRIVTVSRQTGSRGSYFASRLAERLNFDRLHRQVIDEICYSSGYRHRIVKSLDNRFRTNLELMVESLLTGQSFDHSDYKRHLCQVILSMSLLGGVVVVGRGANYILGPRRGFHIRVIAPRLNRLENLIKYSVCESGEAEERIKDLDTERRQFVAKVFGADIDDPAGYDMVINTAQIDIEDLVEATAVAVKGKFSKQTYPEHDDG